MLPAPLALAVHLVRYRAGVRPVHTNYPTLTEDGQVLDTRWEYNHRGQIYTQALTNKP